MTFTLSSPLDAGMKCRVAFYDCRNRLLHSFDLDDSLMVDETHYMASIGHDVTAAFSGDITIRLTCYTEGNEFVNGAEQVIVTHWNENILNRSL